MADLTKIRNLRENQLNEIAIGEIVLNVDALTYVTKNSEGKIVPYDIDYRLPDGDATHLYLKWDETTQAYIARTVAEFISDLAISDVPEGSATALYLKWNDSTDPKRWEALTLAQFKTALAYTTIDAGSATLLYPKWNNTNGKYEPQPPATVATDIGAVSTLNWGNPDGGYKFDGVDDYVTVASNANLTRSIFSQEVFFDADSLQNNNGILKQGTWYNANFYAVRCESASKYVYVVAKDSSNNTIVDETDWKALYTGKVHLIFTYNGTNFIIYVNGVVVLNKSITATVNITGAYVVGFTSDATGYFNGNIYFTRLFNRALTQAEVTKLYNNGRPDLASLDYADLGASQTSVITNGTDWTDSNVDGLADGWVNDTGTPTIVTGNGFTGNAQNIAGAGTGNLRGGGTLVIGKKYRLSLKYRTDAPLRVYDGGAYLSSDIPTNTGDATSYSVEFTSAGTSIQFVNGATATYFTVDEVSIIPIGCVAEYLPQNAGWYSWIETQNGLHGTATGGVIPLSNKIGDTRTAYLLTTSESPTMTDVIKAGWAVQSISMTTAENLTDIDATQETSSVALLNNKTLNNGTFTWSVADHNLYPTADKDLVFTLTGNGGAGTHIYVNLKKIV